MSKNLLSHWFISEMVFALALTDIKIDNNKTNMFYILVNLFKAEAELVDLDFISNECYKACSIYRYCLPTIAQVRHKQPLSFWLDKLQESSKYWLHNPHQIW